MTYLIVATAISFWAVIFSVVVLLAFAIMKRFESMHNVLIVLMWFQMALFVTIIVDDLLIKPTMQCYDRSGEISAFVNNGTPGCTK